MSTDINAGELRTTPSIASPECFHLLLDPESFQRHLQKLSENQEDHVVEKIFGELAQQLLSKDLWHLHLAIKQYGFLEPPPQHMRLWSVHCDLGSNDKNLSRSNYLCHVAMHLRFGVYHVHPKVPLFPGKQLDVISDIDSEQILGSGSVADREEGFPENSDKSTPTEDHTNTSMTSEADSEAESFSTGPAVQRQVPTSTPVKPKPVPKPRLKKIFKENSMPVVRSLLRCAYNKTTALVLHTLKDKVADHLETPNVRNLLLAMQALEFEVPSVEESKKSLLRQPIKDSCEHVIQRDVILTECARCVLKGPSADNLTGKPLLTERTVPESRAAQKREAEDSSTAPKRARLSQSLPIPSTKAEASQRTGRIRLEFPRARSSTIRCSECGQKFLTRKEHDKHVCVYHSRRFICQHCQAELQSAAALSKHRRHLHPTDADLETYVDCTDENCPLRFPTRQLEQRHYNANHCSDQKTEWWRCYRRDCERKYKSKQALVRHIKSKHEGNEFKCVACAKVFQSKCNLQDHERGAHGAGFPCKWQSNGCPETCRSRQSVKVHASRCTFKPIS